MKKSYVTYLKIHKNLSFNFSSIKRVFFMALCCFLVAGCSLIKPMDPNTGLSGGVVRGKKAVTIFGDKGWKIVNKGKITQRGPMACRSDKQEEHHAKQVSYNAYLWSAALQELAFMQIDQQNPQTGILTTAWYVSPLNASERSKVQVSIVSKSMVKSGVEIQIERQVLKENGWVFDTVSPQDITNLQEKIFERAKLLYQQ